MVEATCSAKSIMPILLTIPSKSGQVSAGVRLPSHDQSVLCIGPEYPSFYNKWNPTLGPLVVKTHQPEHLLAHPTADGKFDPIQPSFVITVVCLVILIACFYRCTYTIQMRNPLDNFRANFKWKDKNWANSMRISKYAHKWSNFYNYWERRTVCN